MNSIPALSFCITCKNRLHQIQQTLRKNLDYNILHENSIEFVLIDFGTDGLHKWIVDNFRVELASGYLKYYYTEELPHWHASIAKNTAHLCASGEILVNLDCDNFTGPWGGMFVLNVFKRHGNRVVFHQFSGNGYDGSFGRIAVRNNYYRILGGYDEAFEPMGYQDLDLIKRLTCYGLKYVLQPHSLYNQAITNTKEEGIRHTGSNKTYAEMERANFDRSEQNLAEGRLISNSGIFGIIENLFDHKGRVFHINIGNHDK